MLKRLFFVLYSSIWNIAKPFLKKHKRLQDGYAERLVRGGWQDLAKKKRVTLWIQAASGGEAYLALELLKYLSEQADMHILCTSMTRQGMEVLAKGREAFLQSHKDNILKNGQKGDNNYPEISLCYFPFDDRRSMQRAFSLARPCSCVLLETELWPNFMRTCKEYGARLYVVNGRMTEKTFHAYKRIKSIFAGNCPDRIFATREKDRKFFQEIFPQSICSFMYNIKFDSIYRELGIAMCQKNNSLAEFFDPNFCVYLFASVRKEEEEALLFVIEKLAKEKKQSVLCIVPRHTARFVPWKQALQKKGLAVSFISERMQDKKHACIKGGDIVVWDRFGDLKELYALADYAFVGGSLAPLGGQNFLEPLVYGVIPHTGIHLSNFLWAFEIQDKGKNLAEENLLCLYDSASSLAETFCTLEERKFHHHNQIQQRFKAWLKPLTGDTQKVVEIILSELPN